MLAITLANFTTNPTCQTQYVSYMRGLYFGSGGSHGTGRKWEQRDTEQRKEKRGVERGEEKERGREEEREKGKGGGIEREERRETNGKRHLYRLEVWSWVWGVGGQGSADMAVSGHQG